MDWTLDSIFFRSSNSLVFNAFKKTAKFLVAANFRCPEDNGFFPDPEQVIIGGGGTMYDFHDSTDTLKF